MRSYALAAWINISEHALNTVYALIEITLTSVAPSAWLHLPLCVFMLACYLGVAYITEATQGFYSMFFPLYPIQLTSRALGLFPLTRYTRLTHSYHL